MKRMITHIVLGYWLLFFVVHSMGAFAGSLTIATLSGLAGPAAALSVNGAMRAMPLLSAGMGMASLLVATLFLWAFLASFLERNVDSSDGEVEKIAFGGAGLVFTMLSLLALLDADPKTLLAAMAYFTALLLSWVVTRVEQLDTVAALQNVEIEEPQSVVVARSMASSAAHHNLLAKIAGRERK
jgi:hypothetical protein